MKNKVMPKYNAGVVDTVFCLMFETLWTAPYDRRRGNPLLVDFECRARRAAVVLSTTDLAAADGAQLREVSEAVGALDASVRRIVDAGVFSPGRCALALGQMKGIMAAVQAECRV